MCVEKEKGHSKKTGTEGNDATSHKTWKVGSTYETNTVPTGTLQDKIGGNENHRVFAASHGHLASEILFDRADGRPVDRVRDPTFSVHTLVCSTHEYKSQK